MSKSKKTKTISQVTAARWTEEHRPRMVPNKARQASREACRRYKGGSDD